MRIAFFGLPLAALLLEHDGHEIVYAAICRKGALGTRRLGKGVLKPPMSKALAAVKAAKPDLIVSWFWTTRLPPEILALAPAFGVHPSLLPRHRGPDPYFWAIDSGDAETGVTAHLLAEDYDTGAMLGQKRLTIDPAWNAWTLAKELDRPSLALLREVARAYAAGKPPAPVPQDEALATSAPSPGDELLEIRWSEPAAAIVRRVRAAAPWPGAFTQMGEVVVIVTRARVTKDFPRTLAPGEATVRGGVAVVRAGDDAVELLAGRLDDDEETELGATEIVSTLQRHAPST